MRAQALFPEDLRRFAECGAMDPLVGHGDHPCLHGGIQRLPSWEQPALEKAALDILDARFHLAFGLRPVGPAQARGETIIAENFPICIDLVAQTFPDSLHLLLLDNSGAHTAQQLLLPANVGLAFLPPYCPDLNPMERVWRDLQDALAWLHFTHLDAPHEYIAALLQAYEAATLQSLSSYAYLVEAIHALCA
jgi:hypothetical protein